MPPFPWPLIDDLEIGTLASRIRNPRLRFFDGDHKPRVGALLYLCAQGASSISSLKASWQDYSKKVVNPNPVVLDSAGYASPIFVDSLYKIFLYSPTGSLILSQDNVGSTTLGLLELSSAVLQFWDSNGFPLVGGKLYTCIPGAATLNQLKDSYSNPGLTATNTNPIILDSEGKASDIYASDFYKFFLYDANNVLILTQDDIGPSTASEEVLPG